MNSKYASLRLASVARTDSITSSQADFLATHVPLKKLLLPEQFSLAPTSGRVCSENQVLKDIVSNPFGKHQFIVVYGQSGTGKSHLIRWFETMFERTKQDNEVVLFIRRSDNTLKGTIRQLINKPEISDIANREVYERLVRASSTMDEAKLKDMIYHYFIIEVDHDEGDRDRTLMNIKRKRLSAFLNNQIIHEHMMRAEGPIERIFSKVAESTSIVDRDIVAQFVPDDFEVTVDLYEMLSSNGADAKVDKLAKELMADGSGRELCEELAAYLNQFVNDVVQHCAGIEAGDFRDIFIDIRKELYRIGKNLTLFIEDVTSFTGVDDALLDALIIDHGGMNEVEHLCRISSIVGTTGNYLQNNFRDNHKDRITHYIYIPSAVFDETELFEFVARYLNTMSLPESVINDWLSEYGADAASYPIHDEIEGANWEHVSIENGKELCLYPFTKNSIRYLYAHALTKGQQTPRYIIRDIIEPVVRDAINNKKHFPDNRCDLTGYDHNLPELINHQIQDQSEQRRMLRFLAIWGNGKPETMIDGDMVYISGIPEVYFAEFGLEKISFNRIKPIQPAPMEPQTKPQENSKKEAGLPDVAPERVQRFEQAYALLQKWEGGESIDFSVHTGAVGTLRSAIEFLNKTVYSAINWQDYGIPAEHIERIKKAKAKLIGMERQTRGECMYALPAVWESVYLVSSVIRYNEYGRESWDYPNAGGDAYRLTSWIERTKSKLVNVIRNVNGKPLDYISAVIASEIYRQILSGEFGEKNLKNFTTQHLLEKRKARKTEGHTDKWQSLLRFITDKEYDQRNHTTIRKYFDIPQGGGGGVIVLNDIALTNVLAKVKRARLSFSDEEIRQFSMDPVKLRREAFEFWKRITDRIGEVANQEKAMGLQCYAQIAAEIDCEDIEEDDIIELVDAVERYYSEANDTQFNVSKPAVADEVRKNASRIVQALKTVSEYEKEEEPLAILMAYSGEQNPILLLRQVCDLLDRLSVDMNKVRAKLESRKQILAEDNALSVDTVSFQAQLDLLDDDLARLEGGC